LSKIKRLNINAPVKKNGTRNLITLCEKRKNEKEPYLNTFRVAVHDLKLEIGK